MKMPFVKKLKSQKNFKELKISLLDLFWQSVSTMEPEDLRFPDWGKSWTFAGFPDLVLSESSEHLKFL